MHQCACLAAISSQQSGIHWFELALSGLPFHGLRIEVVQLPYAVGTDGWLGHRMYGAANFLADTDYLTYLGAPS